MLTHQKSCKTYFYVFKTREFASKNVRPFSAAKLTDMVKM